MKWVDQDKAIGAWLDEHGVENYEQCPIIRRTMLYGGSAVTNERWQDGHHDKLFDLGTNADDVIEIGGGVGHFAKVYQYNSCATSDYTIYDLPQIQRVQRVVCPELAVEWVTTPKKCNATIISLFALSEMPYDERDSLLDAFGRHNAMFFAFQERHEDLLNWDWFTSLAKGLRREFAISPVDVNGCWYMYIEDAK